MQAPTVQFRDSRRRRYYLRYLYIDWQEGAVYVANWHRDVHGTPWQIWAGYVDRYEIHPRTTNADVRALVKDLEADIATAANGWDREYNGNNIVGVFLGAEANNAADKIRTTLEDAYDEANR